MFALKTEIKSAMYINLRHERVAHKHDTVYIHTKIQQSMLASVVLSQASGQLNAACLRTVSRANFSYNFIARCSVRNITRLYTGQ